MRAKPFERSVNGRPNALVAAAGQVMAQRVGNLGHATPRPWSVGRRGYHRAGSRGRAADGEGSDGDGRFAGGHVPPGAGEAYWVGGERITFKVRGADTGGAVALIEDEVQPGCGPPPHLHRDEHEAFYVVAGEFTFTLDDQTVAAPAGSLVVVPKGRVHTFRNAGATPGRLVAMIWPAVAFEGFVAEVGTPEPPTGPPDLEKLLAAAAKYGIEVPPPAQGGG